MHGTRRRNKDDMRVGDFEYVEVEECHHPRHHHHHHHHMMQQLLLTLSILDRVFAWRIRKRKRRCVLSNINKWAYAINGRDDIRCFCKSVDFQNF
jgi:hypothetical protein